ncbi:MAG: efflux RND transporter permease subunit [Rhodobacteraceae bacterium]|nr:efflux RND transporter permease subunit [Paracoccaceae bacterium]
MVRDLPSQASGVFSYFTRHKTVANLLMILMLLGGLASMPNMRTQFFPDVVSDTVRISLVWEGAGAEDVDSGIIQTLEPTLMAIDGVANASSSAREGGGSITLDFEPGWDMSAANEDVQAAIDAMTTLPEDAEDPAIRRGSWRDRVTDIVVTGPVAPQQLALFADEMLQRLFEEGISRTTIRGIAAPLTLIEVPSVNLIANNVSMSDIARAIASEVDTDPAGDVSGANARVRTGTQKRSAEDISGIVLRSNPDGSKLTIGDIAKVSSEGVDRDRSYFVGENPAMSIRVDRSSTGDAIEIQQTVEEVAEKLEATLPPGVEVTLIRARAEAISSRLGILVDNGLIGLGLVVILLFLFLNARTAFWVAAGIPVAMFTAVAFMYFAGITINMVSLFGLIITLGIVVDDAIVVGEHADYRYRTYGETPFVAAENAAQKMAIPVFASMITTVIAFIGLTLIGGRFGTLILDIPYTVIMVLIASLMECFLILPHHMAHALQSATKERWYDWPSRQVNRGFEWVRDRLFRPFIGLVITFRYVVVAAVIVVLASQAALFVRKDVTWRFFNSPENGSVTGNFAMAQGATREDTLEMMRELQRATEKVAADYEAEHGTNPLDFVLSEVGGNAGAGLRNAATIDPDLLGGIAIDLIDADLRPYSSYAFVADLRDEVRRHPLAETVSFRSWFSGPGGDALSVEFFGATAETLKAAAEDLKTAVERFPEVSGAEDNLAYDKEELILELTAQGQALGFTTDSLGSVLRNRLNGIEAATYPDGSRSAEIRVELPKEELTADFLERTLMRTPDGDYVPLADIVSVQSRQGFSVVLRENGFRTISVTGSINEDDAARANEISEILSSEVLPKIAAERQVEWRLTGLSEQERDFLQDATLGFMLCISGIYLVLTWVFSSWTRPILIMAIIPFGLIGTIYGHYVWSVPMSMFTVIGLIGMTGIIINDSIVLVTTIDEFAEDRGLVPSIIDGTAQRLRPVMLTTLTTVLGMAPLLYETSQQAQFLRPTVITLVYGLGFGVVIVLLVVPALMAIQADIHRQIGSARRAMRAPKASVRFGTLAIVTALIAWAGGTLVSAIVTGSMAAPVTQFVGEAAPAIAAVDPVRGAFVVFLAGAAAVLLLSYVIGGLMHMMRRSKRPA